MIAGHPPGRRKRQPSSARPATPRHRRTQGSAPGRRASDRRGSQLSLPWSSGVAVDGRSGVLLWRSESAPAGSASALSKRDSRTSLYLRGVSVAGKRNSEPRDNSAENACSVSLVSAETRTRAAEPANSGPFGSSQEISPNVELPGGPGSCATARRFQQLRLSNWPNGSHGR